MRTVGEWANEFRHYFLSAPQRTVTEGSTRPEADSPNLATNRAAPAEVIGVLPAPQPDFLLRLYRLGRASRSMDAALKPC